jgi:hypothetical protein
MAQKKLSDGTWTVLTEKYLGFSTATDGENLAEVYTDDSFHPSLPTSTFDVGRLQIGGYWYTWNTNYPTVFLSNAPYVLQIFYQYWNFNVYKS